MRGGSRVGEVSSAQSVEGGAQLPPSLRGATRRSNPCCRQTGLLRFARNDEAGIIAVPAKMDASMSLDQSIPTPRRLADLPTPCLVLDRGKLARNLATMAEAVARHGVALRPHMKTAKSAEVARMAVAGQQGGITVSTLAEVEHFAAAGFRDILYAVGITPAKLDRAAALRRAGVDLTIVTDDDDTAAAVAAHARATGADHRVLVEVDCGEHRGGMAVDSEAPLAVGPTPGKHRAGRMTPGGHSQACRRPPEHGAG